MGNTLYEVIFVTRQECQHIKNFSLDLLIDANIRCLPVNVMGVAKVYNINLSQVKTLFTNTLYLSDKLLNIFGYNTKLTKYLAVELLSPMIILRNLNIQSVIEIADITKLPLSIATQRFNKYKMLLTYKSFKPSNLESKVLLQFNDWIKHYKSIP